MRKVYHTLARRIAFALRASHPAILSETIFVDPAAPLPVTRLGGKEAAEKYDFLFCYNVLERLDPLALPAALAHLAAVEGKICFVISTRFSDRLDGSGDNLHRSLLDTTEWERILTAYFPELTRMQGIEHDTVLFLTWRPGLLDRMIIGHASRMESISRRIAMLRNKRAERRSGGASFGMTEQALFGRLDGKAVALIGNSRALAERNFGSEIDAHDIVIRCNRAPIMLKRSHGTHTDWIATSIELPRTLMEIKGAKTLLWMSPNRKGLAAWMRGWPDLFVYPRERNAALAELTGARPSTGMMVIELLKRSPCTKIDLYGFDFFRSQSVSSDRTRAAAPHDFDGEEALVRRWAAEDPRLVLHS